MLASCQIHATQWYTLLITWPLQDKSKHSNTNRTLHKGCNVLYARELVSSIFLSWCWLHPLSRVMYIKLVSTRPVVNTRPRICHFSVSNDNYQHALCLSSNWMRGDEYPNLTPVHSVTNLGIMNLGCCNQYHYQYCNSKVTNKEITRKPSYQSLYCYLQYTARNNHGYFTYFEISWN